MNKTEETSAPTGSRRISTLWIVLIIVGIVVVGYVGVQALLLMGAIRHQTHAAWEAGIQQEREQLKAALQEYKLKYGTFPPAENGLPAFRAHMRRSFPRYGGDVQADLKRMELDLSDLEASEALVFWLGGLRQTPDSTELIGFGRDPRNPFDEGSATEGPHFEFDPKRLVDTDQDNWLEYVSSARGQERATFRLLKQGEVAATGIDLKE